MAKVHKLKVFNTAKYTTVIAFYTGIVAGLIYSVGGTLYELYHGIPLNKGTALAYLAIPIMPFYFAFWGFVFGLVGTFYELYMVGRNKN